MFLQFRFCRNKVSCLLEIILFKFIIFPKLFRSHGIVDKIMIAFELGLFLKVRLPKLILVSRLSYSLFFFP